MFNKKTDTMKNDILSDSSLLREKVHLNGENEFLLLAEAMPQVVWITRADGWVSYFNQQWIDYTGLSREESYGHEWNKPFHSEDMPRVWNAWQNALKNNTIYSVESRIRRFDGEYQWWLIRGVPVYDSNGSVSKWFGTCTNINELKKVEEALHKHSLRLENLHKIDQIILLAHKTPEYAIRTTLQGLFNLLQCQKASVGLFDHGNMNIKIFSTDTFDETILETGGTYTEEIGRTIDSFRKNKMEIVEDMSVFDSPPSKYNILRAEGIQSAIIVALVSELEMYGVLNVFWNHPRTITHEETRIAGEVASQITIAIEKARLLKESELYAKKLERQVSERTAQLEETNKELEAFSYSMSHDLRAPLRHITSYVALLKEKCEDMLPDKGRYYLSVIEDASKRMDTLIDDLLLYSRTAQHEIRIVEMDMNFVMEEGKALILLGAGNRKINWKIADLPKIKGDRALLRLVWFNLLGNAVKFTRNCDTAQIEIGFAEEESEFIFHVSDNGAGFDMLYVHKLFGVFQRLHSESEFEGSGIGLANVRRIISKHGGRTWAESLKDQGATFYFTLPKN